MTKSKLQVVVDYIKKYNPKKTKVSLAKELEVSRNTIIRAYAQIRKEQEKSNKKKSMMKKVVVPSLKENKETETKCVSNLALEPIYKDKDEVWICDYLLDLGLVNSTKEAKQAIVEDRVRLNDCLVSKSDYKMFIKPVNIRSVVVLGKGKRIEFNPPKEHEYSNLHIVLDKKDLSVGKVYFKGELKMNFSLRKFFKEFIKDTNLSMYRFNGIEFHLED